MIADASFAIGHRHRVCEDYALAGSAPRGAFAIVSDGCSSSRQSDFGARLLTAAAADALRRGALCVDAVLTAAARAAAAVSLPAEALDATLLCVHRDGPWYRVLAAGDGMVAAIDAAGQLVTWSLRHPTGAPAYLSYLLDDRRREAYLAEHPTREVACSSGVWVTERVRDRFVWRMRLEAARFPVVAVMSDGIGSFDGATPAELLPHMLDFKVLRGAFVTRRLRRFLRRECVARGWRHDDDIALAAIAEETT